MRNAAVKTWLIHAEEDRIHFSWAVMWGQLNDGEANDLFADLTELQCSLSYEGDTLTVVGSGELKEAIEERLGSAGAEWWVKSVDSWTGELDVRQGETKQVVA